MLVFLGDFQTEQDLLDKIFRIFHIREFEIYLDFVWVLDRDIIL